MQPDPSEIFKVLSVKTRIQIIEFLKEDGPIGAKDLAEKLGITVAAVSQHLKLLKHAGLVSSERKGFFIPYSINADALENCSQFIHKVCACSGKNHHFNKNSFEELNIEQLENYKAKLEEKLKFINERIDILKNK